MASLLRSVPPPASIPWSHTATVALTSTNIVLGLVAYYAFPLLPFVAASLVVLAAGAFAVSRARVALRRRAAERRFAHGPTLLPPARGLA